MHRCQDYQGAGSGEKGTGRCSGLIKFQLSKVVPWPVHRYSSKVENALVVAKLIYEQGGCE